MRRFTYIAAAAVMAALLSVSGAAGAVMADETEILAEETIAEDSSDDTEDVFVEVPSEDTEEAADEMPSEEVDDLSDEDPSGEEDEVVVDIPTEDEFTGEEITEEVTDEEPVDTVPSEGDASETGGEEDTAEEGDSGNGEEDPSDTDASETDTSGNDGTGSSDSGSGSGASGNNETASSDADSTAAENSENKGDEEEFEYEEIFSYWNEDAPALHTLIDYVEDVTDENSPNYIPPVDRIATFDMDGTVYAELFPTYIEYYAFAWRALKDPSIDPDEEMLDVARTIRDCAYDKSYPADMPMQHAVQAARAYAGMTLTGFSDFVTEILLRDADGFEGMTYGEAFYLPIIQVIEYLQENDFKVYICSGSDRLLCRTLIEGMIDIPYENIIGMDDMVAASGQGDTDGLDYVLTEDDEIIRTDKVLIKNLKMNKVAQIVRDIGRQPVISFGNTSGDVSMHNYTLFNNPYKSVAFMLIADDEERDYGNTAAAEELREKWEASGYNVISMKNDFLTIYGEDVVKTGSFRWMDELSGGRADRKPAEGDVAEVTDLQEAETAADTQETEPFEVVTETETVVEDTEADLEADQAA